MPAPFAATWRATIATAATYAKALALKANKKLTDAASENYGGDEYRKNRAETTVNLQAEDA